MSTTQEYARAVLRSAVESPYSDFYRRKYGDDTRVQAALRGGDWGAVPFLTRDEIQSTPLWNRIFSPDKRKVNALRPTSGTSGRGMLLLPRLNEGKEAVRWQHWFYTALPIRRVASFSGAQFLYTYSNTERIDTLQLMPGDIPLSAALVERYAPDALAGFPYALVALAPRLSLAARSRVQAVQLFGELCTSSDWRFLQAHFPKSIFSAEYSSIEAQTPVATTCAETARSHELLVHPLADTAHVEIIDSSGKEVTAVGASGEIVLTVLRPTAFPLIRYKTGDSARIIRTDCPCGAVTPLLQIEGRIDIDRLRVSGGEIQLVELDRVLAGIADSLAEHSFEARVGEVMHNGTLVPQLTVVCALKPAASPEVLATRIAEGLRVAPDYTWAAGVAAGAYAPLRVRNEALPSAEAKRFRLVRV